MYPAYKGYFRNGRFISYEPVKIPDDVEVFVIVTDVEASPAKTEAKEQQETFEKSAHTISEAEPLGEKFD